MQIADMEALYPHIAGPRDLESQHSDPDHTKIKSIVQLYLISL